MSNEVMHQPGKRPILVFPGGMPRSIEFLERCRREGQPVVGASSLGYDVAKERYPQWTWLPYVTEADFAPALQAAIAELDIGGIYSPNPVVWTYLKQNLSELARDVELVNDSPANEELSAYRAASGLAQRLKKAPLPLASHRQAKTALSDLELAAIFKHGNAIPGMSDNEKIGALCEVARYSPQGDIVEIGSAWGKSAFVLARLARAYGIGKLLCVDPWESSFVVQNDPGGLVDGCIEQYDYNEMLQVFEMNLLPYSAGDINYLRLPSVEGAKQYAAQQSVTTASFGTTHYAGKIALLHIDGNHTLEAVRADVQAWQDYLVPGGWMIIDDYVWPYGDGPKRTGDDFLARNRERIDCAFVMGTALFVQLGEAQKRAERA